MEIIKPKKRDGHPYIPELQDLYLKGRITRREFLRNATLLGMSVAGASAFLAACAPAAEPTAVPQAAEEEAPAEEAPAAGGPQRGGTWTSSMQLQLLDHPARLSWVEGANIVRQINEYLTETGSDNITRPYLLDRWEASEDVKTWDLYLKQGIKWNNGDDFTADDVLFTFGEWLNEDVGSSMLGLLAYLSGMQDVEKVDDHHVRLHLQYGDIGVPEHLFHYPAVVLNRGFEGDIIRQPVGTGAFALEEYAEGMEEGVEEEGEPRWAKQQEDENNDAEPEGDDDEPQPEE